MSAELPHRKPQIFRLDDNRLEPPASDAIEEEAAAPEDQPANEPPPPPRFARAQLLRFRRIGWGTILFSALSGLVSIGVSIWVTDFIIQLFARGGWLGWVALALALVAALAVLAIAMRELVGFFRLSRVASIRLNAEKALADGNRSEARSVSTRIESLFHSREELKWSARRLAEHRREVLDARELLTLTEREMLTMLDRQARQLVSASARRVAMITAVSPSAIVDVLFVVVENLGMMRRLATLYGGRPGFLGSLRLGRLVLGHLALTGGVALGDDFIQQLVGHGLTARLSARLGEGIMNGAFTGRIGIAAIELCRPLPFIEAERPKLRSFLAELRRIDRTAEAKDK